MFILHDTSRDKETLSLWTKEGYELETEEFKRHCELGEKVVVDEVVNEYIETFGPGGVFNKFATEENDTKRLDGLIECFEIKRNAFRYLGYQDYANDLQQHIEFLKNKKPEDC